MTEKYQAMEVNTKSCVYSWHELYLIDNIAVIFTNEFFIY